MAFYKDPTNLMTTREEIDSYLWENQRRFRAPEYYFGADNGEDTLQDFHDSEFKILMVFFTNGRIKSSSMTFAVVQQIIKDACPDTKIFMDHSFFPEIKDLRLHEKDGLPLWFGNVSHAPVRDYDLVLISHAVYAEIVNIPYSFVHSGVPMGIDQRQQDPTMPPILLGGSFAHATFALFGEFDATDGTRQRCLADGAFYGYVQGVFGEVVHDLIEMNRGQPLKIDKENTMSCISQFSSGKEFFFNARGYKFIHKSDSPLLLDRIEKLDPTLPDKIKVCKKNIVVGSPKKVFYLSGVNDSNYDLYISKGCNSFSCTFCSEGNLSGPFYELPFDELKEHAKAIKLDTAANSMGILSFNPNYYSRFFDLTLECSKHFRVVGFSTLRTDIISEHPEHLELAKSLGVFRLTLAIEGMSDRIRKQVMNKNLSRAQIMQALRNIFQHRMLSVKFSIVLTGWETPEDIEEWMGILRDAVTMRDDMGVNCQLIVTHNPMVMFDHTPLRWMPRDSSRLSYYEERQLNQYIDDLFEMGIIPKFNNRGPSTFLEQSFSDAGPALLDFLINISCKQRVLLDTKLTSQHWKSVRRALTECQIDPDPLFAARTFDDVFPVDILEFTTPWMLEHWKTCHTLGDFSHKYCLRTLANLDAKCYSCGHCSTKKEKDAITKRSLDNEHSIDDVIDSLSSSCHRSSVRIVAKLDSKWSIINKGMLAHVLTAKFLQHSPEIAEKFYAVGRTSLDWVSNHHQRGWFGGTFAFDIYFRDHISAELFTPFIEEINSHLTTTQVLRAYGVEKGLLISQHDKAELAYIGEIHGISLSHISDTLASFDGIVRVAERQFGSALGTKEIHISDLNERVLFVPTSTGSLLSFMYLDARINPYYILTSLAGRLSYASAQEHSSFNLLGHYSPTSGVCRCGQFPQPFSIFENQHLPECPMCMGRKLLYRLTK